MESFVGTMEVAEICATKAFRFSICRVSSGVLSGSLGPEKLSASGSKYMAYQ